MSAEPGTVRPGGRTSRVRAAVLRAAGDVLAEDGFARLDMADVARRAEVGKTTVYRRSGSVTGLVADLLSDMAELPVSRTETGSVLGDLRANAVLVRWTLADPRQGRCFGRSSPRRCVTCVRRRRCGGSTRCGSPSGRPVWNRKLLGGSCRWAPMPRWSSVRCRLPSITRCSPPGWPRMPPPTARRRPRLPPRRRGCTSSGDLARWCGRMGVSPPPPLPFPYLGLRRQPPSV